VSAMENQETDSSTFRSKEGEKLSTELISPIYENGKYGNPWDTWSTRSVWDILNLLKSTNFFMSGVKRLTQDQLDECVPVVRPNLDTIKSPDPDAVQLTWIGHASVLVQIEGISFLTDPHWSIRASPLSFVGPKRIRKVPIELKDLPKIDFVLISHDHYDHLDLNTVKLLGNLTTWFVPKGLKAWFSSLGINNVHELTWWEEYSFNENIRVVCTPCQHWSKRTLLDDFTRLWSSWVVLGKHKRIFFSGDTGYCSVFKTIGNRFGPFDASLIAIGAYCPRWFMKPQHIDPDEAVQIHQDLHSKFSLGIHWGTFLLTMEPETEPPELLKASLEKRGLPSSVFVTTSIGETRSIKDAMSN